MSTYNKSMSQIQVRIDSKTKQQTKKILENLGLDISTAVKMLFKQIIHTNTLPLEIRDINGFRPHKAQELRESIIDAKKSKKEFKTQQALIRDILS